MSSSSPFRVLLLGGSAEGRRLRDVLVAHDHCEVIYSLAGVVRPEAAAKGLLRVGGFGGAEGLRRWLRRHRTDCVIDATHPYASRISQNAATAAAVTGVPRISLWRPGWRRRRCDCWRECGDMAAAARFLAAGKGRRVFLAVGGRRLAAFSSMARGFLLARVIEKPQAFLPWRIRLIYGRPPFTLADEMAMLRRHRIQWLVARNSGGAASYSKMEAAARLALPVLMLRRPKPPPPPRAGDVAGVLAWFERLRPGA